MTIQEIYDIFVDYFKEENTDLQENKIYVKWDKVDIKNETGAVFTIHGLFCCITLRQPYGTETLYYLDSIRFNKQTYTFNEWYNRYIHSHVQRLDAAHPQTFMGCCLGSGPLGNTAWALKNGGDSLKWELFCWELDKYVTVESLAGGPYIKFSSLSITSSDLIYKFEINPSAYCNSEPEITRFIVNNIEIPFCYSDKQWKLGDIYENIVLKINDRVIRAINNKELPAPREMNVFQDCVIRNNRIYKYRSRFDVDIPNRDIQLFTFKGNPVMLKILNSTELLNAKVKLLNMDFINSLLTKMIFYLNYDYGYQKDITNDKRIFIEV